MKAAAFLLAAASTIAVAADADRITPFSGATPGAALPSPWEARRIPGVKAGEVVLVEDAGTVVLRVRTQGGSSAASHRLRVDPARRPVLAWRWKVDRVVASADMARREGDDFAARVYVFFDLPEEEVPAGARVKLALARWIHGEALPTAGLCYVWDNRHRPGASAWNPYTDRIRMIVIESGPARAGRWIEARRDLEADFRAAFGDRGGKPVPAITGVAAGNDTDQTGEAATAWFGDLRLLPR